MGGDQAGFEQKSCWQLLSNQRALSARRWCLPCQIFEPNIFNTQSRLVGFSKSATRLQNVQPQGIRARARACVRVCARTPSPGSTWLLNISVGCTQLWWQALTHPPRPPPQRPAGGGKSMPWGRGKSRDADTVTIATMGILTTGVPLSLVSHASILRPPGWVSLALFYRRGLHHCPGPHTEGGWELSHC